ncbi:MAG: plasmid mobilization relaxosome protein MobC [Clostridia bacterium]
MANRTRNVQLHFMVSAEEKQLIHQRMKQLGTKNMGAYLRKISIDGYVLQLDTTDVRELVRVLRVTSNSLNQLTKRAHETGNVYSEDIEDLRKSYDKLWGIAEEIMVRLASI